MFLFCAAYDDFTSERTIPAAGTDANQASAVVDRHEMTRTAGAVNLIVESVGCESRDNSNNLEINRQDYLDETLKNDLGCAAKKTKKT